MTAQRWNPGWAAERKVDYGGEGLVRLGHETQQPRMLEDLKRAGP